MSPKELARAITKLEEAMLKAAKSLEFERAAQLRDQLATLQSHAFKSAV